VLRFEQSPGEGERGGTTTLAPPYEGAAPASGSIRAPETHHREGAAAAAQRAARRSLKAQIARLEQELSAIVADGFPFISSPHGQAVEDGARAARSSGPRLCDLAELERVRDRLAARLQQLRGRSAERAELESLARETLERMKLEPGRYKFVRLPVSDLGQGGCGVWEVRPRLGLIGMLAGWWQVKLSSGCPLAS
jgi:hypothetical protein